MGYASALLRSEVAGEESALRKQSKKKSLWGSIGRTVGGLLAMGVTGGMVNPLTVAAVTGAATYAGGAIGSGASGKIKEGRFLKSDRAGLKKELGAFGTKNLTSSLRSAMTAGMGQKLKLAKSADAAKEGGASAVEVEKLRKGVSLKEGYKDSFFGKLGAKDSVVAPAKGADIPWKKADSTEGASSALVALRDKKLLRAPVDESGIGFATSKSTLDPGKYANTYLGPGTNKPLSSSVDVARAKSEKFYSENVFGVGDKAGEVIPISEATPRALRYGDQTVTSTYGSREAGEYLFEDKPKESALDYLWSNLGPTSMEDRLLQQDMRKIKGHYSFDDFYGDK